MGEAKLPQVIEYPKIEEMTTEDLIKWLTQGGLFLLAVFLGVFIAPDNPVLVLGICGSAFAVLFLGRMGRRMWILYPLSAGFSGAINLIPGGLSPFQVVSLLLAAMCLYFLKADPEFRIRLGPAWIFWPLGLFNLILVYNWIKGRDLGLNLFGSRMVNGKGYVECIVPFIGYVAAISIRKPDPFHDRMVPLYVLGGYVVDTIIFAVSTIFPFISPHLFRFYSNVNIEAFEAVGVSQTAAISQDFVLRFGASGVLAFIMLAALQSYLPYARWLSLPNIIVGPFFLLLSLFFSLISGFRNTLAKLILIGLIGLWQSFRVYSLFLLFPVVAGLGLLLLAQGNLFKLPPAIQRTLTWLPGDWDPAVKNATEGSSKFRKDLRRVYFAEFFRKENLLGEGYLYDRDELLYSQERFWRKAGYTREMDEDESLRGFIIRRSHHEGILNVHHITGHVGTLVWISFGFLVLVNCVPFILLQPVTPETSTAQFGAVLMTISIISFWLLFGSLRYTITEFVAFAFCYCVGIQKAWAPLSHPDEPVASSPPAGTIGPA